MKRTITIIGSGMMGSALAFPAFENGNEVRLVGTPLDREIIEECKRSGKHPKFDRPFPEGVEYFPVRGVAGGCERGGLRYRRSLLIRRGLVP